MAEKLLNPTPWVITTLPGSRDAVKAAVATAIQKGIDGKPADDQSLIEVGKTAIAATIDLLPEQYNAATVRADGRFTNRGLRIVIEIEGTNTL